MHVPHALTSPSVAAPLLPLLLLLLLVCCRATGTFGGRGDDGTQLRAATKGRGRGVGETGTGEALETGRDNTASRRLKPASHGEESHAVLERRAEHSGGDKVSESQSAPGDIRLDFRDGRGKRASRDSRTDHGFRGGMPTEEDRGERLSCDQARLQCTVRAGCQMALNTFFLGCGPVLSGQERGRCPTACQHALVSLLATEDGAGLAFVNCDCGRQRECRERKRRMQVCQEHVLPALDRVRDPRAPVSCSFARWICEAATSCLAALRFYARHCGQLFAGRRCTAKCRNSLHILYSQPNAHKLRSCRCQGDEGYDCPSLVNNTERLCFRSRHQRHQHRRGSTHHRDDSAHHRDDSAHHRDDSAHHRDDSAHHRDDSAHHRDDSAHRRDDSAHHRVDSAHHRDDSAHHYDSAYAPRPQQPDRYDRLDYVSDGDFRRPGPRRSSPNPSINTALRRRHASGQRSASAPSGSGAGSGTVIVALATSVISLVCVRTCIAASACVL